jgi:hypothetical protein
MEYTRRDAERAFERLCDALDRPHGDTWARGEDGQFHSLVGVWSLDYAGCYGGYVVEEISNLGGGVSRPLGEMRRTAREFCDAVSFTLRALELAQTVGAR